MKEGESSSAAEEDAATEITAWKMDETDAALGEVDVEVEVVLVDVDVDIVIEEVVGRESESVTTVSESALVLTALLDRAEPLLLRAPEIVEAALSSTSTTSIT